MRSERNMVRSRLELSPLFAQHRFGLLGLGLVGGVILVIASAGFVKAADGDDMFSIFRNPFAAPPVQRDEPVGPVYETRRVVRRVWRRERRAVIALRRRPAVERRMASRPPIKVHAAKGPAARPAIVATPMPASSDRSVTVDPKFVAAEQSAFRSAALGRGGLGARQTLCVRLCDGYAFPIGGLSSSRDLGVHRTACDTSCPGAATALFTQRPGEDDIAQAVSLGGQRYGALRTAFTYREKQVPACSCHGPGQIALPRLPLRQDATLRPGDVVAGRDTAYVLTAGRSIGFVDFRTLRHRQRDPIAAVFAVRGPPAVRVKLSHATPDLPAPTEAAESGGAASRVRVVMPALF